MMNYSNSAKHPQQPSLDTLRSKGPSRKTFLDPELQPGIYIYAGINACRGIVYRRAPLPLPSTLEGRTTLRNYGFEILRWFSLSLHLFPLSSLFFGFDLTTVSRRSLPREGFFEARARTKWKWKMYVPSRIPIFIDSLQYESSSLS